jgi:hypothetical protein
LETLGEFTFELCSSFGIGRELLSDQRSIFGKEQNASREFDLIWSSIDSVSHLLAHFL